MINAAEKQREKTYKKTIPSIIHKTATFTQNFKYISYIGKNLESEILFNMVHLQMCK